MRATWRLCSSSPTSAPVAAGWIGAEVPGGDRGVQRRRRRRRDKERGEAAVGAAAQGLLPAARSALYRRCVGLFPSTIQRLKKTHVKGKIVISICGSHMSDG
jgi:putative intracellular protease/amidase